MNFRRLLVPFLLTSCFLGPRVLCQETHPLPSEGSKPSGTSLKVKSIDDIEAIGSRSIGKSGVGNWYSLEKEIALGRDFAATVEASSKLMDDPIITEYVN